jgi:hypothetical protein
VPPSASRRPRGSHRPHHYQPRLPGRALAGLAEAAARAGDHDPAPALAASAEAAARTVTDRASQAGALTSLADAAARAGDYIRAEAIARTITDPYSLARAPG